MYDTLFYKINLLKSNQITLETDFTSVWKIDCISSESVLIIAALLKCLVYAISKNCSYDKELLKHTYLPNVFVLFIDLGYLVIIQ